RIALYQSAPTHSTPRSSDLPTQELLNPSFASRSSLGSCSTATIPPHAFTSFVTDYQQSAWPTQPQPPRHPTPITTTPFGQNPETDFVLYPSAPPPSPARRNIELVRATSGTVPNQQLLGSPLHGKQQLLRQNSTHQVSSASPVQNPRVSDLIQATGHVNPLSSSQRFSPTGQHTQQQFYASSAPSSSTSLAQQPPRPPVPLFSSNSTGNMQHSTMASLDFSEGSSPRRSTLSHPLALTHPQPDLDPQLLEGILVDDDSPFSDTYDYSDFGGANFAAMNHTLGPSIQTVSPQDLENDLSAPASSTLTNFETPATTVDDSPHVYYSNDTSPAFEAENISDRFWPPLFPGDDTIQSSLSRALNMDNSAPAKSVKMTRQGSSPGMSSSRGSPKGRQPSNGGITKKRRSGPLPPIVPDPNDPASLKRCRNTAAARTSRAKKAARFDEIELRCEHLEEKAEMWRQRALNLGYTE
ncbi:MAG: hypothetical protein Q9190_007302, partial [Brigantiaea leucoxantha]